MKSVVSDNKLRGGYYTPAPIAQFLADWAITKATKTVLEPSCGDGSILEQVARRSADLGGSAKVTGVELDEKEAKKARLRLKAFPGGSIQVLHSDFFAYAKRCLRDGTEFDVVIGNPPFVRYQDFPEEQRNEAFGLLRAMGLNPSRLTNLWMPFLALSAQLLSKRGRLAMVIPAELFQVGYAAEVRQFLADYFPLLSIVAFQKLVFPNIQQEIVLLLAERRPAGQPGIRVLEVDDAANLSVKEIRALKKQDIKPVDHAAEKWTKYFLDKKEILLLRKLRERTDIPQLHNFIDIDVGVVTGDNDFFLLSEEEAHRRKLREFTIPIVGRSAALAGIIFDDTDFEKWASQGRKTRMFLPTPLSGPAAKAYIRHGEKSEVHAGYKCRIRREWYVVPSVWTPAVFFLRQADQAPRMVANFTKAICTDTLHRGKLVDGMSAEKLCAAFTNSLTFAASEVTGRSYGGGVMTFEPSEVEKLPLPVKGIDELDVRKIDQLIRAKETVAALDYVDSVLLIDGLGLKKTDIMVLRGAWAKLKNRRRGRKR